MKKLLMVLLVAVSMVALTTSAQALTFSLSGVNDGVDTGELLRAEFTDIADGVVQLTLQTLFADTDYASYYVTSWYFNFAETFSFADLTFSGTPAAKSTVANGFEFYFGTGYTLQGTNTFTYSITGAGLNAEAFNVPSNATDPYAGAYTYANIQYRGAIGGGNDLGKVSVYDKTSVSAVPEPATFLLLGGGLLALVGFSRKLKK